MSLFNDKDLKVLLASIQAKSIIKKAQKAEQDNSRLALPLIENLKSQLEGGAATTGTSIKFRGSTGISQQPDVRDFRSLGDFIRWAATNKLTWRGQRFAWSPFDNEGKPAASKLQSIDALNFNRVRGTGSATTNKDQYPTDEFQFDKNLMIEYLKSIRDNEALDNKVLEVMIKSNINELNRILESAGESKIDIKSPALLTKDILDDFIVDGFSTDMLDDKDWNSGLNNAPLFSTSQILLLGKHVKSAAAFKDWLSKFKVLSRKEEVEGMKVIVPILSNSGNPCLALYVLYKRANWLKERAIEFEQDRPETAKNYSKYVEAYLSVINQLQNTVKDPITGGSCSLTSPESIGGTKKAPTGEDLEGPEDLQYPGMDKGKPAYGKKPGYPGGPTMPSYSPSETEGRGYRGGRGGSEDQEQLILAYLLGDILTSIPWKKEAIYFSNIYTFLSNINRLKDPFLDNKVKEVVRYLRAAQSFVEGGGMEMLPLQTPWEFDIKTGVRSNPYWTNIKGPNYASGFCNYTANLHDAINSLYALILMFFNRYEEPLKQRGSETESAKNVNENIYRQNRMDLDQIKEWGGCTTL